MLVLGRYGRLGSTSRLRFYQFVPYLAEHGFDVESLPLLDDDYVTRLYSGRPLPALSVAASYLRRLRTLLTSRRFDLLWIEKELFPWLPAAAERLLRAAGVPYAVDYDDATFHRYDTHAWPVVRAVLGRKIDSVMRHAALVVVGNEYLGERAAAAGARRVERIPTVVDHHHYAAAAVESAPAPFTVGWIGSPSTERYLEIVRGPLSALLAEGGARLRLVGATASALAGVPHDRLDWSEDTEAAEAAAFDVGIMPVPDEPFERGKCGFKLIQYMAAGRPVVASPVGANADIVVPGINGMLARTDDEWLAALRQLRDDASLRATLGRAGARRVATHYSIDAVLPRLVAALTSAAASR